MAKTESGTKKILMRILIAIVVIAIIFMLFEFFCSSNKTENIVNPDRNTEDEVDNKKPASTEKFGEVTSANDLQNMIDKIYEDIDIEFPALETVELDVTDENLILGYTGLENGDDLEYLVVSQAMMSSQAYEVLLAKVKDGKDADAIAKEMSEKIDMRKWICVEAEKLYATTSGDVIFVVMTDTEKAQAVYDSFKAKAETVGELYERNAVVEELPPEMY